MRPAIIPKINSLMKLALSIYGPSAKWKYAGILCRQLHSALIFELSQPLVWRHFQILPLVEHWKAANHDYVITFKAEMAMNIWFFSKKMISNLIALLLCPRRAISCVFSIKWARLLPWGAVFRVGVVGRNFSYLFSSCSLATSMVVLKITKARRISIIWLHCAHRLNFRTESIMRY